MTTNVYSDPRLPVTFFAEEERVREIGDLVSIGGWPDVLAEHYIERAVAASDVLKELSFAVRVVQ